MESKSSADLRRDKTQSLDDLNIALDEFTLAEEPQPASAAASLRDLGSQTIRDQTGRSNAAAVPARSARSVPVKRDPATIAAVSMDSLSISTSFPSPPSPIKQNVYSAATRTSSLSSLNRISPPPPLGATLSRTSFATTSRQGKAAEHRPMFGVRIQLPHALVTVILCDQDTTVQTVIEKSLLKMKHLLGVAYDVLAVGLVDATKEVAGRGEMLVRDDIVAKMPEVIQMLQQQKQPCFRLQLRETSASPSPTPSAADETNEVVLKRSMSMNNSRTREQISTTIQFQRRSQRMSFDVNALPNKEVKEALNRAKSAVSLIPLIGDGTATSTVEDAVVTVADIRSSTTEPTAPSQVSNRPDVLSKIVHVKTFVREVDFVFADQDVILRLEVDSELPVTAVKQRLWKHPDCPFKNADENQFAFRYILPTTAETVELFDEDQFLYVSSLLNTS